METDTSSTDPALNWKPVNPPPPCGQINRILVIAEVRRIVLACDSGLYWSAIPAKPSVAGTYSWTDATPANVQQGRSFSGLAKGPGWTQGGGEGTIAAAKWGGYAPYTAVYSGGWSGGALQLTSSDVDQGPGNLFLGAGRTSIASCPADPTTMYGVAEDGQDNMAGTWKSTDGGAHWL